MKVITNFSDGIRMELGLYMREKCGNKNGKLIQNNAKFDTWSQRNTRA
jgi:hypothetical protein